MYQCKSTHICRWAKDRVLQLFPRCWLQEQGAASYTRSGVPGDYHHDENYIPSGTLQGRRLCSKTQKETRHHQNRYTPQLSRTCCRSVQCHSVDEPCYQCTQRGTPRHGLETVHRCIGLRWLCSGYKGKRLQNAMVSQEIKAYRMQRTGLSGVQRNGQDHRGTLPSRVLGRYRRLQKVGTVSYGWNVTYDNSPIKLYDDGRCSSGCHTQADTENQERRYMYHRADQTWNTWWECQRSFAIVYKKVCRGSGKGVRTGYIQGKGYFLHQDKFSVLSEHWAVSQLQSYMVFARQWRYTTPKVLLYMWYDSRTQIWSM